MQCTSCGAAWASEGEELRRVPTGIDFSMSTKLEIIITLYYAIMAARRAVQYTHTHTHTHTHIQSYIIYANTSTKKTQRDKKTDKMTP